MMKLNKIFAALQRGRFTAVLIAALACVSMAQAQAPSFSTGRGDPLAWLGPLPADVTDADYDQRLMAVSRKIVDDMASWQPDDIRGFRCRTPAQLGAVPDMNAVDRYIARFPDSARDPKLRGGLYAAGAKGNWLAVALIVGLERQSPSGQDARVQRYRMVQLMEWLQARKVGPLYREFGAPLVAEDVFDGMRSTRTSAPDVYAALHGSYPAQYEVGADALASKDAGLRAIGQQMQDCARKALPAYRRQLQ